MSEPSSRRVSFSARDAGASNAGVPPPTALGPTIGRSSSTMPWVRRPFHIWRRPKTTQTPSPDSLNEPALVPADDAGVVGPGRRRIELERVRHDHDVDLVVAAAKRSSTMAQPAPLTAL